jgi:large subunit ribosomal protein L22
MAKNVEQNYASQAYLKMAMVSPQRCRLVAELVRGKSLDAAHRTLLLEKVKSAKIILSLLKSALANAQQKGVADLDRLFVSEIQVNEGPRIKRHMPRAQGRADVRLSRTSHIILKLSEKKAARKTGKAKTEAEAKKSNIKGDR